jgi:hypothetical protein
MKGTMLIFRPHEPMPEQKDYASSPTLDELKTAIGGGWIELVPGFNSIAIGVRGAQSGVILDCVAFCDEEGKLKHLPPNDIATVTWDQALRRKGGPGLLDAASGMPVDRLCGTVIVLFGDRGFMASL